MVNTMFKKGDIVTRKKYGNDILFKIDKIDLQKEYIMNSLKIMKVLLKISSLKVVLLIEQ